MTDTTRIDWESMRAARQKYRQAVCEAERVQHKPDRKDLEHTLSKLGMFLDEATYGAFRASEDRAPDTPPTLS